MRSPLNMLLSTSEWPLRTLKFTRTLYANLTLIQPLLALTLLCSYSTRCLACEEEGVGEDPIVA